MIERQTDMKGSLHLPLRGAPQHIVYAHQSLYVASKHEESLSLGLYRFPLHAWIKDELKSKFDEAELASSAGLQELDCPHGVHWIGHDAKQDLLWLIDQTGQVFTLGSDDENLSLRGQIKLHAQTIICLKDALYVLSPTEDEEWLLSSAIITQDQLAHEECWRGQLGTQVEAKVAQVGPELIAFGLSDGRVALWFESTRKTNQVWSPNFAQTHQDPICALGFVFAEEKHYLLSYSEDLTLAQTRLDDLEAMPRAAKAKGLHSTAPNSLITGPLGRFYTVAQDGVRAWKNEYSNYRPISHDELCSDFSGTIKGATFVDYPDKNLDGQWTAKAGLILFDQSKLALYELMNTNSEQAIAQGEDTDGQKGRLNKQALWRAEGRAAWTKARLQSEHESTRKDTLEHLIRWGDSASLLAIEKVATQDESETLRQQALEAMINSDHPSVMHALIRLLASKYSPVSQGALNALRQIYGSDSLYPLQKALELGEESTIGQALKVLGELGQAGNDQAKGILKVNLNHENLNCAELSRQQLELCYPAPRSFLIGLRSKHISIQTMTLHRLWQKDLCFHPIVNGRLQQLREDNNEELRHYAFAVTILSHPDLAHSLRAQDAILHTALNKIEARLLKGEERDQILAVEQAKTPPTLDLDQQARQLLFEISACGQADIAVYGPVALAASGDLRALPTLLALSRSPDLFIRERATHGLALLATNGEKRAQAQLERLVSDEESNVRLCAYQGLASISDNQLDYAELGLQSGHHDIRLSALNALQDSQVYQDGILQDNGQNLRLYDVLLAALCRHDDLILAQEARKIFLKDLIGGSKFGALALILESVHDEVRRLSLSDLLNEIQNESAAASDHQSNGGGGLNGQSFVFTGTLTSMKRADAQKQVKALGGVAASGVSASLSYLVIGDAGKAGSKLSKANSLGVSVISESEFTQLINNAKNPTESSTTENADTKSKECALHRVIELLFNDTLSALRKEALKRLVGKQEGDGVLIGEQRHQAIDLAIAAEPEDMKLQAIEALCESIDLQQAFIRLHRLVSSPLNVVAHAALKAALRMSDDHLESLVLEGLAFDDSDMRNIALAATIKAPKKYSWREGILFKAISDGVASIRELAFEALQGHEQVSVAAKLLEHPQSDIRNRAALTLAQVGDERALKVALDILHTPAPNTEDVLAAQEAVGGEFGLLDDLQWKRQVTLALSAQQRAFASASAASQAQVNMNDSDDEQSSTVVANASAIGIAYAEQSLHALVSVNDQIESAVERSVRRWQKGLEDGIKIIKVGRFEGAFETIWGLLTRYWTQGSESKIDESLASKLSESLKYCAPDHAKERLAERLKSDDRHLNLAWALTYLGDSRGFAALSTHNHDDQSMMKAAISFGAKQGERALAKVINQGSLGGESVLYAEIIKLINFGGDCPMMIAGLSSDNKNLRRRCAQWIGLSHDLEALQKAWQEEMESRRPQAELKYEAEWAEFEAGKQDKKPTGSKPKWISASDWTKLAECLVHPLASTRAYASDALFTLPQNSQSAKVWLTELDRQYTLAVNCAKRLNLSVNQTPKVPKLMIQQDEAQALAFGAYASLVTAERDSQSLDALSALFHTDPMGSKALIQLSLRLNDALQKKALHLLDTHSEVLNLSDLEQAKLLISSSQTNCVERGAQLLAQIAPEQAESLILNDDSTGAKSATRALLEHQPDRAFELFNVAFASPNAQLRAQVVSHWVNLLKVWPSEKDSLTEHDHQVASQGGLSHLELKLLQAMSNSFNREQALAELLKVYQGESAITIDVQALVAEALLNAKVLHEDEKKSLLEPLQKILASTEPSPSERALKCLQRLKAPSAARIILERLLDDPTQSANESLTFSALEDLADPEVVPSLLEELAHSRFDQSALIKCIFKISGHHEPVRPPHSRKKTLLKSVSDKEDTEKTYYDDVLSQLLLRLAQLGLYSELTKTYRVNWNDDFISIAKTSHSSAVDKTLLKLVSLPVTHDTQEVRQKSFEAIEWRIQERTFEASLVLELLKHKDRNTKIAVSKVLAYGQRSEGVPLLMGIARDTQESYDLREQAIAALGASKDVRAVSLLIDIHNNQNELDPNQSFKDRSLAALSYFGHSESADDILKLITAQFSSYYKRDDAIIYLYRLNTEAAWKFLHKAILTDRWRTNELMLEALFSDPSSAYKQIMPHVMQDQDLRDETVRLAYRLWCQRLQQEAQVSKDHHSVLIEPAIAFFKTNQTRSDEWTEVLKIIAEYGQPRQWVELCFAANKLSSTHQDSAYRFGAKLSELNPAPLDLLLPRLPSAIENAPKLAEMTLSILGTNPANLAPKDLDSLKDTTLNIRQDWLKRAARIKAGATGVKLESLSTIWRKLLWLWGRANGGQEILMDTLQYKGLHKIIYQEILFALENKLQSEPDNFELDQDIFSSPAMQYGDLRSLLTRIAVNSGLQIPGKINQVSLSLADWDAIREMNTPEASEYALNGARLGDVFALNTLIAQKDHQAVCQLLEQLANGELDEMSTLDKLSLVRASARLARLEIENALVTLAQQSTDEQVQKEAWRARRRAKRRRLQLEVRAQ